MQAATDRELVEGWRGDCRGSGIPATRGYTLSRRGAPVGLCAFRLVLAVSDVCMSVFAQACVRCDHVPAFVVGRALWVRQGPCALL